jgi:hypothetical protein
MKFALDALSAAPQPLEARKPADPGHISDETGPVMVRKIDNNAARSVFQRALAESAAAADRSGEPKDSEASPKKEAEQGWDPYDVWLRRVHQPRSRGGNEPSGG